MPPSRDSATCPNQTEKMPVVNELLCFVQNKVESLPADPLIKLCTEFYSVDIIIAAKKVLYETVTAKHHFIERRGTGKAKASMQDIIRVFQEMDLDETPVFVARNLLELPPLSLDNMDNLKLLSDIEAMKQQLKIVTDSQRDIVQILNSSSLGVTSNIEADIVKAAPDHQMVNKEADVVKAATDCQMVKSVLPDTLNHVSTDTENSTDGYDCDDELDIVDRNIQLDSNSFPVLAGSKSKTGIDSVNHVPRASYRQVLSRTYTPRKEDSSTLRPHSNGYSAARAVHSHNRNAPLTAASGSRYQSDQYSRNRSHTEVVIGSGPNMMNLKAARTNQESACSVNHVCSGVFVSRLAPRSTVAQVAAYIKNSTGYTILPEKIPTRFDTYSSFFVRCDQPLRGVLMDANVWPAGSLIKYYFN